VRMNDNNNDNDGEKILDLIRRNQMRGEGGRCRTRSWGPGYILLVFIGG